MKTIAIILIAFFMLTSFRLGYPCHPNGDLGPCTHPRHTLGDLGPCTHTYWDTYGNLRYVHTNDVYPCTHPLHTADVYPCSHICW